MGGAGSRFRCFVRSLCRGREFDRTDRFAWRWDSEAADAGLNGGSSLQVGFDRFANARFLTGDMDRGPILGPGVVAGSRRCGSGSLQSAPHGLANRLRALSAWRRARCL
jgi:hypothetical protein